VRVALLRHHDVTGKSRQILLNKTGVLPVLGLGYIQAALEADGHEVLFLDAPAMRLTDARVLEVLRRFRPGLTGVTCTTPTLPGALRACELAKQAGSATILGGPHTSVYGVEHLVHPFLDYVGVGEGVTIMRSLARALDAGDSPDGIVGLVTRTHDGGEAPYLNLSDMPWPSRDSLRSCDYRSIMQAQSFATMVASRGCPFNCSFCFRDSRKALYRDANDVVDEMEYLVRVHGVKEIVFYDDVFTLRMKRVHEICREILRRKLDVRWEAPTRVDLVDRELLTHMARAGCHRLRFGVESGSPEVLQRIAKHSTVEKVEEALNATKSAGIGTFGYFIVGYPGETVDQYQDTVEFACRVPLDYATFYVATPLPATELFRSVVASGAFPADYWLRGIAERAYADCGDLVPDAKMRAKQAYRRFYLRPGKVPLLVRHATATGNHGMIARSILGVLERKIAGRRTAARPGRAASPAAPAVAQPVPGPSIAPAATAPLVAQQAIMRGAEDGARVSLRVLRA
jgi:anaerobic magnesium-protoporphyrin IX monomethyl ester cyclase